MLVEMQLSERIRPWMLREFEYDLAHNQLYFSPMLSNRGLRDYVRLLHDALLGGSMQTLAAQLRLQRRLQRTTRRIKPNGESVVSNAPLTNADKLAESEFNRYYLRALCQLALADKVPFVIVSEAQAVINPQPDTTLALETAFSPQEFLDELRAESGKVFKLGVGVGPRTQVRVRLAQAQ